MNWIINTAVKFSGLGWVWEKIDGAKTYIGGAAEMLTGLGAMLTSGAAELNTFTANVHSIGELWSFLQALTKNPDPAALAFIAGWGVVLHGWSVIAKKHADDKRHDELLAAATQNAPATPPAAQP